MERIEPIRRDDAPRGVAPVAPVARRDRERGRDEGGRRGRRAPESGRVITRDDDGTPHVDIRA
jgi:hypothetical protein